MANYVDVNTGEKYWIAVPRKDGFDRVWAHSIVGVQIDEDVAEEYWRDIRTSTGKKKIAAIQRRGLRASEVAIFVKASGRKAQKGVEPNDRHADPEFAKKLRRMRAQDFDRLIRDGEEGES